MPRGGHPRSGPRAKSAAERRARDSRTRPHHDKVKGLDAPATKPKKVLPPPMLTEAQREFWDYYAPLFAQEGRLTLKARDVLAKYCVCLAMVKQLNDDIGAVGQLVEATESGMKANPLVTMLRQYMQLARQYETDLLANPASDVRAPGGDGEPEQRKADPMAKFAGGARRMKLVKGAHGA